ncbi:MAG: 4Fe-4S binding protein [Firmicutes bacterium]|nr:4Fe-4S binding protein [Bacillota bacterium]
MKITHIYFSPNGETKKIALHFHEKLDGNLVDFTNPVVRNAYDFNQNHDLIILSIPVYSQNIPYPLRSKLKTLKTKYLLLNLSYGGFSYGNMLKKIERQFSQSTLIGYSVTPVGHIYLHQKVDLQISLYNQLIKQILDQSFEPIKVKFKFPHIFAQFFEKKRTQFNYRLSVDLESCINCGLCIEQCPTESITETIEFKDSCLKCGHCESICPTHAIHAQQSFLLKQYLKKKQKTSVIIR